LAGLIPLSLKIKKKCAVFAHFFIVSPSMLMNGSCQELAAHAKPLGMLAAYAD